MAGYRLAVRRSSPEEPGIIRRRAGSGFTYRDPTGATVDDATRERVRQLAIPPAWQDVWICADPDAHLLATGVDAAGRRQYLYHPRWREQRDREKFDRILTMAPRLSRFRRQVRRGLGASGQTPERVGALALWLLDTGRLRVGTAGYEEENGSHGVTTLLTEHVRRRGPAVELEFPAKGGQVATVRVRDAAAVRALVALRRAGRRGEHLMRYRDGDERRDLTAEQVGTRFTQLVGNGYTVKDLRTWAATVVAAESLARTDLDGDVEDQVREALQAAADSLGDTLAVARDSYVDPRLVEAHRAGRRVRPARGEPLEHSDSVRRRVERELVELLGDR